MATTQEYALLSLYVYDVKLKPDNRPNLPTGWTLLEAKDDNLLGFSYGVFKRSGTGEIVLAYTGANGPIDWASNFTAGTGLPAWQVANAALVYSQAKQTYGSNITLSGHSLGGGLASVMATWFNRPAVVFDEAPFQLTAANPVMLGLVRAQLLAAGYSDVAMDTAISDFSTREAQVANHYLQGEILNAFRIPSNTVAGSDIRIDINGSQADGVQLHAVALLAAASMSDSFRLATYASTSAVPLIMDDRLYAFNTGTSIQKNFLIDLIRSEQSAVAGQGKLSHFAADLNKLGTNIAGLNDAAQKALIAQGIEWYYWQGTDYAGQQFFADNAAQPGLLQYTTAQGDGLAGAKNKAVSYLNSWLTPLYNASGEFGGRVVFDQWSVAASSTGATATARDASKSQIFIGGTGTDSFTGGEQSDVILAGDGADTLDGGVGSDSLYGGAGADRYNFTGSFGGDIVLDADGSGSIWVDDVQLSGGKKLSDNVWESADGNYSFSLMGGNLIIGRGTQAGANTMKGTVTVQGWSASASLGITLDDAPATTPTGALFFNGDQRAKLIGIETQLSVTAASPSYNTYAWSETAWANDGTLTNGVLENNFSDVINASAAGSNGSVIHGWGGNDALSGSSGKDDIFGDDGDDLVGGGAGSDNIRGGDGADYINSSATLSVAQRLKPGDSWSPPAGQIVLSQGALWGIYKDTLNGEPTTIWSGSNNPAGTDGDVVDAGAGNDQVIASGGDDRVQGGLDDDQIDGMGGNDVLEGGDGKDIINGDGLIEAGFMNSVTAALHGADFVDGGAGDDTLTGAGGNDVVYGGADNDQIWGDVSGKTGDADYLDLAYHGNDYLDGEGGNDYIEGGGKDDTLYGGADNDNMWGDTSASNVDTPAANALMWGNDYLDGEDGDDSLVGGGKNDTLYGGIGNDKLWGDESNAALAGEFNGNDYLDGGDGNDQLMGGGGDDILYGGTNDDTLMGDDELTIVAAEFQGADYLDGEDGNDILAGGGGDDTLLGGIGNDYLDGGAGADFMDGGVGSDTYIVDNEGDVIVELESASPPAAASAPLGFVAVAPMALVSAATALSIDNVQSSVSYTLGANLDNLTLTGTAAINGAGNALDNVLTGNSAANVLTGGAGNDFYYVDNLADSVVEAADEGDDVVSSSVSFTLADNVERLQASGAAAIDLTGNTLDNSLFGNSGNNILTGGAGNDSLVGNAGNDVYVFNLGDGQDSIDNTDFLHDTAQPALLGATDTLRFGAGITDSDVVGVRSGDNLFLKIRGTADQVGVADYYAADVVNGTVTSDHKIDRVEFANGVVWDQAMIQTVVDRASNNHAPVVSASVPALKAYADTVFSYVLPAGVITDSDAGDSITYSAKLPDGSGLPAWLTFDAATQTFSGTPTAADLGSLPFVLWGTDNYGLAVGTGVNLSVAVANSAPVVATPLADQNALRDSSFAYTVPAGSFTDPDASDVLTYGASLADGSVLPSWLGFDAATQTFSGTASAPGTLSVKLTASDGSLAASDVFDIQVTAVNHAPVLATPLLDQTAAPGSSFTYTVPATSFTDPDSGDTLNYSATLADGSALPAWLVFDAATRSFSATSSVLGSTSIRVAASDSAGLTVSDDFDFVVRIPEIVGTSGNDVLTGGPDNDIIRGLDGNDTIHGGFGDDTMMGDGGDDTISADGGMDTIDGGAGNDFIAVRSFGKASILFGRGDDQDTVRGEATFSSRRQVPTTVQFKPGIIADDVTARRFGTSLVVTLNGSTDSLTVLDYFYLDFSTGIYQNTGTLTANGVQQFRFDDGSLWVPSADTVGAIIYSSGGFDSGTDYADIYYGDSSNNFFQGFGGNDELHGGAGADLLQGFDGNDALFGDDGNDQLYGYSGDDRIEGGAGNDYSEGGAGSDTYVFARGSGQDSINNERPADSVEIDTLLLADLNPIDIALSRVGSFDGNDNVLVTIADTSDTVTLAQYFLANAVDGTNHSIDRIEFADGTVWDQAMIQTMMRQGNRAPVLAAALADQTAEPGVAFSYTVPSSAFTDPDSGDVLTYSAIGADGNPLPEWLLFDAATRAFSGTPTNSDPVSVKVTASDTSNLSASDIFDVVVSGQDMVLNGTAGADNLVGGAGNDTLNGLAGNDTLSGGAGDDTLNGGTGADTMRGGTGDDTYVVNVATDVVTELAAEGVDIVRSSVTLTLAANVEDLTLTGTTAINGTGNSLDNVLTGNSAKNTLTGGAGNDTYVLGRGYGADTVQENDATAGNTDVLEFIDDIATDQIWLRQVSNNLEVSIIGSADKATLTNWYLGSQYHVEQFKTSDGKTLLDSQVQNLVSAMAAFSPPPAGQTTLSASYAAALTPVIAANWQ